MSASFAARINSIVTNNIFDVSNSLQGLLFTDLSDNFRIFHIDRKVEVKET